ncbi:MAG: metallophosphoesterase [Planctomycetes bacterium]|nr:metallophosphoesterase [Planctomycetota bacterium]MCB9868889.1 metallophosphoesterase [Planctomycetota bacterium]
MRLFAISDLHLSFGVDKPMDVFGPQWVGHADKMRAAWDARITADDWVLVGGDTSWGLTLDEARPDLEWLGARPGQKVLIKGNHCHWWSSLAKVRAVVDPSIHLLQNTAVKLTDGTVVIGARLWDPPGSPWADENTEKVFLRELERLKLSIAAGAKLGGSRTIALVHYPPRYSDGRTTPAVELLEGAGAEVCVYGHLHGKDHRYGFQGEAGGIRYYLASCDAIEFAPIEIELDGSRSD